MRYTIRVEVDTEDEPNVAKPTLEIASSLVATLWDPGSLVYVHVVSLEARSDEGVVVR